MTDIQKHMLKMFIALRWGVGLVGLSLPVILAGVGYWIYDIPLAGSMSAYYHATKECSGLKAEKLLHDSGPPAQPACHDPCSAIGRGPMRNWFVGCLFFMGGAMLLMKGFSVWEDLALDIAGVMAPCVALFPMNWGQPKDFNPHATFAIAFFVSVGFTCVFCSQKTLKEMPPNLPNRDKVIAFYRRWYRFLGISMVVAPLCAHLVFSHDPRQKFVVEAAGVWAFGFYWLFKTSELKRSDVEVRALMGQLRMNPRTLR